MLRALSGSGVNANAGKNARVSEAWLDEVATMELGMNESGVSFAQSIVLPIAPVDTLQVRVPAALVDALQAEVDDILAHGSSTPRPRSLQLFVVTAPALENWTLMDVQPVLDASPARFISPAPPLSPTTSSRGRRGSGGNPGKWPPAPISTISEESTPSGLPAHAKGPSRSAASSGSGSNGISPQQDSRRQPSGSYATDNSAERSPASGSINAGGPSDKVRHYSAPDASPAALFATDTMPESAAHGDGNSSARGSLPLSLPNAPAPTCRKSTLSDGSEDDTTDDEQAKSIFPLTSGKQGKVKSQHAPRFITAGGAGCQKTQTFSKAITSDFSSQKLRGDLRHMADMSRNEMDLVLLAGSRRGLCEVNTQQQSALIQAVLASGGYQSHDTALPAAAGKSSRTAVRFSPPPHSKLKESASQSGGQYAICKLKFASSVPAVLVRILWRVNEQRFSAAACDEPSSPHS
jgi:hypothetical protein